MTSILVSKAPKELQQSIQLIKKFCRRNRIKFEITIKFDYHMPFRGYYISTDINTLNLNPDRCEYPVLKGFHDDVSMYGVLVHEFCHWLIYKNTGHETKDIYASYKRLFYRESFIVNETSKENKEEEFVELFNLFITNPFYLKLLDCDVYDFISTFYKPTFRPSIITFKTLYNSWPEKNRHACDKKLKFKICLKK